MAGIRDDSAGDYGQWINPQDQSWLDYLGMKAADVGGGAYNALANITGALSPVGTSPEGNMSLQVPPMVSGLVDSAKRIGQRGGFTRVPELDEQLKQDLSNVVLSLYGGNALAGLTKPRGSLGAGAMREAGGLPMDHASRMARAKEMGFDTDKTWYHGTTKDFSEFDPNSGVGARAGTGSWFTDNPDIAASYAGRDGGSITPVFLKDGNFVNVSAEGRNWQMLDGQTYVGVPVGRDVDYGRLDDYFGAMGDEYASTNDVAAWARKNGHDGARFQNIKDRGAVGDGLENVEATNVAVFDPRNIRSVNAAFDPAKADSANLLYSRPVPLPPQQDDNLPPWLKF